MGWRQKQPLAFTPLKNRETPCPICKDYVINNRDYLINKHVYHAIVYLMT